MLAPLLRSSSTPPLPLRTGACIWAKWWRGSLLHLPQAFNRQWSTPLYAACASVRRTGWMPKLLVQAVEAAPHGSPANPGAGTDRVKGFSFGALLACLLYKGGERSLEAAGYDTKLMPGFLSPASPGGTEGKKRASTYTQLASRMELPHLDGILTPEAVGRAAKVRPGLVPTRGG